MSSFQVYQSIGDDDDIEVEVPHFYAEICIAIMLFCFVGGSIAATAYIESYIDQTGIVEGQLKSRVVFVLWIAITIGRFVGLQDQISLSDFGLVVDLSLFCVGGFLAMLLIYLYPHSSNALWFGVAMYGFFHGPTVGFCQVGFLFLTSCFPEINSHVITPFLFTFILFFCSRPTLFSS